MLKKGLLLLASSVLLFSSLNAADITKKTFEDMPIFKEIGAKVSGFVEVGKTGIYKINGTDSNKQQFDVAVDRNGDYIFILQGILDTKTKQPITIPTDVSGLKDKESFSYGNGKEVLYIFTDPECPFCKKFEVLWPKLKDKYTLKVFLYNLPFHKKADAMSYYVLGGGTPETAGDRMVEIANGNDKNWENFQMSMTDKVKYDTVLKEAKEVGNSIGIKGTPTVFDTNGKTIVWSQLLNN